MKDDTTKNDEKGPSMEECGHEYVPCEWRREWFGDKSGKRVSRVYCKYCLDTKYLR